MPAYTVTTHSHRGAIHVNEAADDYEFLWAWGDFTDELPSLTIDKVGGGIGRVRYGVDDPLHYVMCDLSFTQHAGTGLWDWNVHITAAWGTWDYGLTGQSAMPGVIRIRMPAHVGLTVGADCNWSLSGTYWDIYGSYDAVAETLINHTAPVADSGAGFDLRYDTYDQIPDEGSTSPSVPADPPGYPSCLGSFAAQTAFSQTVECSMSGYYLFKEGGSAWLADALYRLSWGLPTGCGCEESVLDSHALDSGNISFNGDFFYGDQPNNFGSYTCHCENGNPDYTVLVWNIQRKFRKRFGSIFARPRTSGMPSVITDIQIICNGSIDDTESDPTGLPYTPCDETHVIQNHELTKWCLVSDPATSPCGIIHVGDPPPDPTACVPFDTTDTRCDWKFRIDISIPTIPSCAPSITDVDEHQTTDGEHFVAYVDGGEVWSLWSPFTGTDWRTQTNITGGKLYAGMWERPRIYRDLNLRVHLIAYHAHTGTSDPLSTGLYYFYCDNTGTSWAAPTLISMAATAGMIRGAKDGPLMEIISIPDSGTSGPCTFQVRYKPQPWAAWSSFVTAKDQAAANLHGAGYQWGFDHASESADRWTLTFVPVGGSTVVTYFCADLKNFTWELH